jgi:endonuclease YncB( thermonuclease family)
VVWYFGQGIDVSLALIERGLALNPRASTSLPLHAALRVTSLAPVTFM